MCRNKIAKLYCEIKLCNKNSRNISFLPLRNSSVTIWLSFLLPIISVSTTVEKVEEK